jgi:hypothetical protein
MLHVFIGEIIANMTQVSDAAPGPLVFKSVISQPYDKKMFFKKKSRASHCLIKDKYIS